MTYMKRAILIYEIFEKKLQKNIYIIDGDFRKIFYYLFLESEIDKNKEIPVKIEGVKMRVSVRQMFPQIAFWIVSLATVHYLSRVS